MMPADPEGRLPSEDILSLPFQGIPSEPEIVPPADARVVAELPATAPASPATAGYSARLAQLCGMIAKIK
jgi:hypothetical protein